MNINDICRGSRKSMSFYGHERRDTVFVVLDDSKPGMLGMIIARVLLFMSFVYRGKLQSCAFVNWFVREDDQPDEDTEMWVVRLECDEDDKPICQVIDVDTIARGAHLLPVYGSKRVSDGYSS